MSFVKIIETIGSSPESWEAALKNAVDEASHLQVEEYDHQSQCQEL